MQSLTKSSRSSPAVSIKMDDIEDAEKPSPEDPSGETKLSPLQVVGIGPGETPVEQNRPVMNDLPPTKSFGPSDHSAENGPSRLAQYSTFWDAYNEEADREDKELVEGFGEDLNNLLIFAGLFSGINTAFIIESYKDLKQDAMETTNKLLRTLIHAVRESTAIDPEIDTREFRTSARAIRVNVFFFTSLACSLFAAFGAVIGKQWLSTYKREGQLKSKSGRGIERQKKYMGMGRWKFQAVVETLPTLLQFSLFFFFIGLIDFLYPLNNVVVCMVAISSALCLIFWVATTTIGVVSPDSPFQTRLTALLRRHLIPSSPDPMESSNDNHILEGRCVDWLKQRTTVPNTIGMVAKAVVMLPEETKKEIGVESAGVMIRYILQSTQLNGRVYFGISLEGLQYSLPVLRDLVVIWDRKADPIYPGDDAANASFAHVFATKIWSALLTPETPDDTLGGAAIDILLDLDPIDYSDPRPMDYLIRSLRFEAAGSDYRLKRLRLLHDSLTPFEQRFKQIDRSTIDHIPSILVSTMWFGQGSDKQPDLDPHRVFLRLSWLLNDFDSMYQHLMESSFGRYLFEWRAKEQDLSSSFDPLTNAKLYLRTVLRLLVQDHDDEVVNAASTNLPRYPWSKKLENSGNLVHLSEIARSDALSEVHFMCLVCFLLVTNVMRAPFDMNAPFTYFKLDWVKLVLAMLDKKDLIQGLLSTETFPPAIRTRATVILFEYLISAKRLKLLEDQRVFDVFNTFHALEKHMGLKDQARTKKAMWNEVVGVSWVEEEEWKLAKRGVPEPIEIARSPVEPEQKDRFPETMDIVNLVERISKKAEVSHTTRQKLLRIISRAHDLCEGIQEEILDFNAGIGWNTHIDKTKALHDFLATVDEATGNEPTNIDLASINIWESDRSLLFDTFKAMHSSPLDLILSESWMDDLVFATRNDDLAWLSTLYESMHSHASNDRDCRTNAVSDIASIQTELKSSTSRCTGAEDETEPSRILAIRCAMRVYFMMEALTDNQIFVGSGIRDLVIQDDLWQKAHIILRELLEHVQGPSDGTSTLETIREKWDKFEKSLLLGYIPVMTTALKCEIIFEKKRLTEKPNFIPASGTTFDNSHNMPFAVISLGHLSYRQLVDLGEDVRVRSLDVASSEGEEDLLVLPAKAAISHPRGMKISPDQKLVAYCLCDTTTGSLAQVACVSSLDPQDTDGSLKPYSVTGSAYLESIFWLDAKSVAVVQSSSTVYRLTVGDKGLANEPELLFNIHGSVRYTKHGFFPSSLDGEWVALNISSSSYYEPEVQYWSKKDNNTRTVPGIGTLAEVSSGGVLQTLLVTVQKRNSDGTLPIVIYQLDHRPFNRPSTLLSTCVTAEGSGDAGFIHVFEDLGIIFIVINSYFESRGYESRGLLFDMHTAQKLQDLPHSPAFIGMFARDNPEAGKGVLLSLDQETTAYRLTLIKEEVGRLRHEWSTR